MDETGHSERLRAIIEAQNRIAAEGLGVDGAMDLVVALARTLTGADAVVLELARNEEIVFAASAGTVTSAGGAQSVIAAPLWRGERSYGEVKAYSATWQAFARADSETLELLGAVLASHLAGASGSAADDDDGRRDPVTSLGNRRAYEDQLASECSRARRHGHSLTLCVIGLDGLDHVNEVHGEPAGHEILRQVGATLGRLRTEDMAFRIGEDQFAVVLPSTTSEEASVPVERLAAHIASRSFGAVTAAFGLADGPLDPASLHAAADASLMVARTKLKAAPAHA
jgi:diguanylate cyclase (GGDEF)-like protein